MAGIRNRGKRAVVSLSCSCFKRNSKTNYGFGCFSKRTEAGRGAGGGGRGAGRGGLCSGPSQTPLPGQGFQGCRVGSAGGTHLRLPLLTPGVLVQVETRHILRAPASQRHETPCISGFLVRPRAPGMLCTYRLSVLAFRSWAAGFTVSATEGLQTKQQDSWHFPSPQR